MADEPKKDHPEDIESILSDLDAILTDMGGDALAAAKPAEPPKEAPKPIEVPKPVEPPKPAEPPKPVEIPKPVEAPKPPQVVVDAPKANQVELAPRDGMIKPPEKKPEPPKPAPKLPAQSGIELSAGPAAPMPPTPPPPPPPPAPTPVPAPAKPEEAPKADAAAAPAKADAPPADAPKEQIRRVAYIYTSSCSEVKTAFAAFLSQASRTISKKPLFLREVLSHEVGASSDPNAVVMKAQQAKAVAVLAVVEDWPAAKVDDLSDACSRANLLFRAVAPADAQKKSTAVDVIVDMMLLPGEG